MLSFKIDNVAKLQKYINTYGECNYTHQALHSILMYYNNVDESTEISDIDFSCWSELDLEDLEIEYDLNIDWNKDILPENILKLVTPIVSYVTHIPFHDTYLILD
jgi:hypothetical protein